MGRERRAVRVKSQRGVSQEVGGEAGLEQACKVRAGRTLVGSHQSSRGCKHVLAVGLSEQNLRHITNI